MNWRRVLAALAALGLCLLCQPAGAYSVFTHEELIDLAWSSSIRPLLLARFPGSTDAELREAHSFAYGGCAIQDMGYYPFAKQFFSNLTHYVRSGDFVSNLLNDATTRDEYAFAIGALSHISVIRSGIRRRSISRLPSHFRTSSANSGRA